MVAAVEACKNGMPFSTASKQFGVPRMTLKYKVWGKTPIERKMGPKTVLTKKEEDKLVEWIKEITKKGFPPKKDDLVLTVQKIVANSGRETPFIDGKPGKKWIQLFLKRHSDLSPRVPETLTSVRASVTESQLRGWFNEVQISLQSENLSWILTNPQRLYNLDESAFQLCPKSGKVIGPRGEKNIYDIKKGSDKESLTVLLNIRADGIILPPFILFPYTRMPGHIVASVPDDWSIGKTESGWMTGEAFYEYVANCFLKWAHKNNVPFPLVIFLDGHKSHLTMHLHEFCVANKIILIALHPNATHLLQPCDVSVFGPLKAHWKNAAHSWKFETNNEIVSKTTFPLVFQKALKEITSETVINGFRKCGLFPWNADSVDFSRCVNNSASAKATVASKTKENKPVHHSRKSHLEYLESFIPDELLEDFRERYNEKTWNGAEHALDLFNVWIKMKNDVETDIHTGKVDNEAREEAKQSEKAEPEPITNRRNEKKGTIRTESPPECLPSTSHASTPPLNSKCLKKFPSESSNSSVGTPFKKALFWPEVDQTKTVKKPKEKIPSVVTSKEWKKFFSKKEADKKAKEQEKEARKIAREQKRLQKTKEKEEKLKTQKDRKRKRLSSELSSDSENSGEFSLVETSDEQETFSDVESAEPLDSTTEDSLNLIPEHYYAVFYQEQFYIGRFLRIDDEGNVFMKFLKEVTENNFVWPKKQDDDTVERGRLFYGPIKLFGNEPFFIDNIVLKKIKSQYRQLKLKK